MTSTDTSPIWPEWLTPTYSTLHTLVENAIKEGTLSAYASSDSAGQPWTEEGMISVQASHVLSVLERAGFTPPAELDPVDPLPLPSDWFGEEDPDAPETLEVVADLLAELPGTLRVCADGEVNIRGVVRPITTLLIPPSREALQTLVAAAKKARAVLITPGRGYDRRRAMASELGHAISRVEP